MVNIIALMIFEGNAVTAEELYCHRQTLAHRAPFRKFSAHAPVQVNIVVDLFKVVTNIST